MGAYRKMMKREEVPNHARFLTFSCYRRLGLFENDAIKDAFVEQVDHARERTHFQLIAWVVMPEHVHLLVWPEVAEFPVAKVCWWLKRDFARLVLARWRELDAGVLEKILHPDGTHRFWQRGGGYYRNIFSGEELAEKIRYIHENPVRRGLVERAEDWKWSSARWYSGERDGELRIDAVKRSD